MEITKELLQKYAADACNAEEKQRVEHWLSHHESVTGDFDEAEIAREMSRRWTAIAKNVELPTPPSKVVPLHKKIARYAAAACVAIMIYLAGALLPTPFDNETKRDLVEISPSIDKGSIYVSRLLKKSKRYSADNYIVNFRGAIRIYSTEIDQKTIVCNGEPFILQPHKYYFLIETIKGGIQILDEEPGELDHFASLKTTFQLCA